MINNKTVNTSISLVEIAEKFADMIFKLIEAADGNVEKAIKLVEKQHFPKNYRKSKKILLRTLRWYKRWGEGLPVHRKEGTLVK